MAQRGPGAILPLNKVQDRLRWTVGRSTVTSSIVKSFLCKEDLSLLFFCSSISKKKKNLLVILIYFYFLSIVAELHALYILRIRNLCSTPDKRWVIEQPV